MRFSKWSGRIRDNLKSSVMSILGAVQNNTLGYHYVSGRFCNILLFGHVTRRYSKSFQDILRVRAGWQGIPWLRDSVWGLSHMLRSRMFCFQDILEHSASFGNILLRPGYSSAIKYEKD